MNKSSRKLLVHILALIVALLGTVVYIISGKDNWDRNLLALQNQASVKEIATKSTVLGTAVIVKCKSGSSYQLSFPHGSKDFSQMQNHKCR